jgi:hypothetical protein
MYPTTPFPVSLFNFFLIILQQEFTNAARMYQYLYPTTTLVFIHTSFLLSSENIVLQEESLHIYACGCIDLYPTIILVFLFSFSFLQQNPLTF